MIKELHGKHYYIELNDDWLTSRVWDFIEEEEALLDEKFYIKTMPNNTWSIVSESRCEAFRGAKYRAWERVKRRAYKLKKEMTETA